MKKKRIGALALCCAMLGALLISPAQAATGSVTDAKTGKPVAGAQLTCQWKKSDGSWVDWIGVIDPDPNDPETSGSDTYGADFYGQNNPMYSDANGRYGWMQPAGTYRVVVKANGYQDFTSEEYTVGAGTGALSPSDQVNIALKPNSGGEEKPPESEKPSESDKPTESEKPPESEKPAESEKPVESEKPSTPSGGGGGGGGGSVSRPDTEALVKGNLPSGKVQKGSQLTLTAKSGVTIRYTTDGTTPTLRSQVYKNPIPIDGDMTVKVAAVRSGMLGSVVSYTYTLAEPEVIQNPPAAKIGTFRTDAASIRYLRVYGNNLFRPDRQATGYEVAGALAYLVALDEGDNALPFTDVDAYYAPTVAKLVRSGLINGMTEDTFQGEGPMTRCQLCKVLVLALELEPGEGNGSFPDVQGHWAAPYIGALTQAGYIKGYTDGTFRPDRPVTRAELVALLNRIVGRANVAGTGVKFQDVGTDFWGYEDIQKAAFY